jgi:hypothetical protein
MIQWLKQPAIFVSILFVLFGIFVWPTPWNTHFDNRGYVVRVARLTGLAEIIPITRPDRPILPRKILIDPERAAAIHHQYITAKTDVEATGILVQEIANAIVEGTGGARTDWDTIVSLIGALAVGIVISSASRDLWRRWVKP